MTQMGFERKGKRMTTLINIHDAPEGWKKNPDYLYIGRPSYLGNPFVIGKDGTREEVVAKYRKYIFQLWDEDNQMFRDYMEKVVLGSTLVCYCAPKLCHGSVILEMIDRFYG